MSIQSAPHTHTEAPHTLQTGIGVDTPQDTVVHAVDGIEEYDNRLPNWWLFTFYAAIAFGVVYYFHYQMLGGETSIAAYEREMQPVWAAEAARLRAAGAVTPAMLQALSRDQRIVAEGQSLYTSNCVSCHSATGGGGIGANLTDSFWIHGGRADQIYRTVTSGVTNKGMPAWGAQLGVERTQAVVAYVLTLRNTNAPGGRSAQGTREE
ncbi:MAG: c-type cytochrome [Deltaproteobacteria bacterium]|nr:c-type cytochrome [Deltaproteobacteria bacterium]